jgi:hypothetical protein
MKTRLMTLLTFLILAGFLCISAKTTAAQSFKEPEERRVKPEAYDGNWWLAADSSERSGFLDGARDCLVWIAHAKLPRDVDNLEEQIEQYYDVHPSSRNLPVSTVWQKVAIQGPPATPRPAGGEVYTNPHGYYDGEFWRTGSESSNRGFLEGYLWCIRTCVKEPTEAYSRSIDYYFDKIWNYVQAYPKAAQNETIADILFRFRDRPKTK